MADFLGFLCREFRAARLKLRHGARDGLCLSHFSEIKYGINGNVNYALAVYFSYLKGWFWVGARCWHCRSTPPKRTYPEGTLHVL